MRPPKHQLTHGPFRVDVFQLGADRNHFYLVTHTERKESLLIDAAFEIDQVAAYAQTQGWNLRWVFITHGHWDHAGESHRLQHPQRKFFLHQRDRDWFDPVKWEPQKNLNWEFLQGDAGHVTLWDNAQFQWVSTPGHTPGGCCLILPPWVFTGDVLFIGRCGRADFRGGDPRQLYRSLHHTLHELDPSLLVCSGHDYGEVPFRTLGEEFRLNPYYQAKDENAFVALRMKPRMTS